MVEACKMKQTVNHQSREFIVKRDTVIFRLPLRPRNTNHDVAEKSGFDGKLISHRKGKYVGSLVDPPISCVQTLHPVVVYE